MRLRVRTPPGVAGGAVLFGLGAIEAVRLARGDPAVARASARNIGATRLAAAIALLLRPALLPQTLGMAPSGQPAEVWLPRLLAVREATLGAAVLAISRTSRDPLPLLAMTSVVDAAEAVVVAVAVRRGGIVRDRGRAFVLSDLGSALAGLGVYVHVRRRRGR